ncbi:MAG: Holliday junction resolvase RuvX [Deltaproteobacteria bacterium]
MGRALGLDLGDRRIGLAVSDPLGLTAQGVGTLVRVSERKDLDALAAVALEREAMRLVLGLPRNMDGSEGPRAQKTRAFAEKLKERLSLPLFFWDERLSTAEAERVLIAADVSRRRRKEVIDTLAAQIILQGWLDAGGPESDCA